MGETMYFYYGLPLPLDVNPSGRKAGYFNSCFSHYERSSGCGGASSVLRWFRCYNFIARCTDVPLAGVPCASSSLYKMITVAGHAGLASMQCVKSARQAANEGQS